MDPLATWEKILLGALALSSLLTIAYLLPIVTRAFFASPADTSGGGVKEAPIPCLVGLAISAAGCVVLFFYPGLFTALLGPLVTGSAGP